MPSRLRPDYTTAFWLPRTFLDIKSIFTTSRDGVKWTRQIQAGSAGISCPPKPRTRKGPQRARAIRAPKSDEYRPVVKRIGIRRSPNRIRCWRIHLRHTSPTRTASSSGNRVVNTRSAAVTVSSSYLNMPPSRMRLSHTSTGQSLRSYPVKARSSAAIALKPPRSGRLRPENFGQGECHE
jgi:hypothetical protein